MLHGLGAALSVEPADDAIDGLPELELLHGPLARQVGLVEPLGDDAVETLPSEPAAGDGFLSVASPSRRAGMRLCADEASSARRRSASGRSSSDVPERQEIEDDELRRRLVRQLADAALGRMHVEIVSAHASNNAVAGVELSGLIRAVFDRLTTLDAGDAEAAAAPTPAVSIRRSVTDDHIVCLECGRKLKMLKRHLSSEHDMTPEQYLARWGLKPDYRIVAPAYARKRRDLALSTGLGRKPEPPPKPKRQRRAKAS